MTQRRVGAAFQGGVAPAAAAAGFPGIAFREPEDSRRTLATGGLAVFIHIGGLGFLILMASLVPVIEEKLIPVQLIKDQPPPAEEPAPAPRALAERRQLPYAPALQTVAPQIVNTRVVADASPRVSARKLDMNTVNASAAPTQINRASTIVERVSRVNSIATARASAVDVTRARGPAVRGPVRANLPAGPSVGPRQVAVATTARSIGTGTLSIGGSSVKEGIASTRDVLGSPTGAPLVRVDTAVGDGFLRGSGGKGSGVETGGAGVSSSSCFGRKEVQDYLVTVEARTMQVWHLPRGASADQNVTLRFQLDVAGSANRVSLVRASDNALGASAVDALRAASPFPAMSEPVRCLANQAILATFSNPLEG